MKSGVLSYAAGGALLGASAAFFTGSTSIGIGVVAALGGVVGAIVGYYERKAPRGDAPAIPLGVPVALGVGIGAAVGVSLDNHVIGIASGAAIGLAAAAGLRRRNRRRPAAGDDSSRL